MKRREKEGRRMRWKRDRSERKRKKERGEG